MQGQTTLGTFATSQQTPEAGWPIYHFHCLYGCGEVFCAPDPEVECPNCGRKHPQNCGFQGDQDLARTVEVALEASEMNISPQALDASGAIAILERLDEPIPETIEMARGVQNE
jgi:hypothetical protein